MRRRCPGRPDNAAMPGRAIVCIAAAWLALAGPARAQAPVPDTMAQRALACTACHGAQGRVSAEGYVPRIAGKPAGYLLRQMLAFRDGRRAHEGMARLMANLTDDFLRELAQHFASLDLPYAVEPDRSARPAATPAAQQRGDTLIRRGDAALDVPACEACHGAALAGVAPGVPGLLGLPRDYLLAQLGAWRNGTRRAAAPDCMAQIAQRLSAADIPAVADALAARPVPMRQKPADAAPARWPLDCGSVVP
jgi:cytochrome c553